jgi:hypothetical protein
VAEKFLPGDWLTAAYASGEIAAQKVARARCSIPWQESVPGLLLFQASSCCALAVVLRAILLAEK